MFRQPDWAAAIDFQERLAVIPEQATVRGMFIQCVIETIGADLTASIRNRRYVGFKSYPMRDYVELLMWGCKTGFPRLAAAEAVRRMGRRIYPNYAATITGTAIFAVAGRDFRRVVELTPAAYKVSVPGSQVTVRLLEDHHAIVELRELWNLPDYHQVGIWEGAMEVCNAVGQIEVLVHDHSSVDFDIHWRDRG